MTNQETARDPGAQRTESESLFHAIFEKHPESLTVVRPVFDHDGRFTDAEILDLNQVSAERHAGGMPRELVRGRRLFDAMPQLRPIVFELVAAAAETRMTQNRELRWGTAAAPRWSDVTVFPFDGGLVMLGREVTARHAAVTALEDSEARFRAVTASAPDAVVTVDSEGHIAGWNRAAEAEFGYTEQEMLGRSAIVLVPEAYARAHGSEIERVLHGIDRLSSGRRVETTVVRRDGTTFDCEVSLSTWHHGEERFITAIIRDVTERRAAAGGMARLAAAIEQTSESVVITDADATITYVNPAFERISGYARTEAIGLNPRVLKSGQQSDEFYLGMWETLLAGSTWRGEMVNRRKDGSLYTEVAAISPVRDGSGTTTAYVAVKRDVTGERAMERQLRQSQRLEAIGQLAGGVAHDFNNLLTAITGYAEMAREALPAGSEPRADIEEALVVANRAATLTRQLLAFSRRQALEPTVLDPVAVVDELAPMLRRLIGPQVQLVTSGIPGTLRVRVDRGQLEQVVVNLAVNARDAMPDGGRLSIDVAAARDPELDQVVRIVVADTGVGMYDSTLDRAFEPFFTTKEHGKGTGMGLATVHGIVHQSSGQIAIASEPGRGSTFTIDLPRVATADAMHPVGPAGERTTTTRDPGVPGRILLVEDEPVLRSFLARTLEGSGCKVYQAGSGDHALDLWKEGGLAIDLLVTDVGMPGIQGPELAWRMRALRPDLPILFISGFAAGPELNAARRIGTATLVKPFETALFVETVRRMLEELPGH